MTKIAVVCANGKAGRLITEEALSRNLDVTAIVRGENKTKAQKVIVKDLMALTKDDLAGFDVVIDAYGGWTDEGLAAHSTTQKHLCDLLSGSDTRLLVVGGAGSLYLNPEHTMTLADSPDFPESYQPVAQAMAKALGELRKRDDVKWTYVSPAADFRFDGERTGNYILAGEEFTLNAKNESMISYADFAAAMIDEATSGDKIRQRISVVGK